MNKNKVRFLSRKLFTSPAYLGFCTTEKTLHNAFRTLKLPEHKWVEFNHATAHVTSFKYKGDLICIMCLDVASEAYRRATIEQIVALVAHEVTHIKQRIMEDIGEDSPSKEFEAYMIQELMQTYMNAYRDLHKASTQ